MTPRTCEVVGPECTAPAGWRAGSGVAYGDRSCRGTCFACGSAVCAKCSRRRVYRDYGRQRICESCAIEHGLDP